MNHSDIHKKIEIKAKIRDYDKIMAEVQAMCSSHGEIIQQEDVFFNSPNGRLKLRKRSDYSVYELVYYEKSFTEGPKLSLYSKCNIPHGEDLLNVLKMSLGVKGIVRKTRRLFLIEHSRIHIDDVEGLGKYFEIEVSLTKDQTPEEGEEVAKNTMAKLGIPPTDVVTGSYLDNLHESISDEV